MPGMSILSLLTDRGDDDSKESVLKKYQIVLNVLTICRTAYATNQLINMCSTCMLHVHVYLHYNIMPICSTTT